MKKIYISTLGCAKNQVDSEVLGSQLKLRDYTITAEPGDAEWIIINTCGFITDAKEESVQAILEAVAIKKQNPRIKVLVGGCLSQRYKKELPAQLSEVDAFFGTEDYQSILEYLQEGRFHPEEMYAIRARNISAHYAYIKISEGCDHTCAFCAIPAIRGAYRSRRIEDIITEAGILAGRGVKELILVSQDTSSYGKDLYGRQRIIELVTELARMEVFTWIRTLYWYPANFPLTYIELMNRYPAVIPYLDMPIQHASDRVLGFMRRAENEARLTAFYKQVREIRPDIALRTTLLIGHPGEQEEDFDAVKNFIQKICFDRLGTFVYSDEEGTLSYGAQHKVPRQQALRRRDQIMKIQQRIALDKNRDLLNTVQTVLLDTFHADGMYYLGRTYRDAPEIDNDVIIHTPDPEPTRQGTFQKVMITDTGEYELYGTWVV
jgi:ribosomal protein S12 methylthiotransferase